MYQTILVPVDGSPLSERALPYARVLAAATKARLILVRVVASSANDDEHTLGESEGRSSIETYLHNLAASHIDSTPIASEVVVGDAAPAILAEAARTAADVIVMSTHGRSGIGRWIYGSVADAVMRRSTVPVLLIPATCSRVWTTDGSSRILVPLDGSDLSEAALGPASDLADAMKAELVLLRVVEPHPVTYAFPSGSAMVYPEPELEAARAYLKDIGERVRSRGRTVRVVDELGFAVSRIVDVAHDQQADLVALSSHGSGGLTRLVLGSVATGVVQSAGVPVLVVRPIDAATVTTIPIEPPKSTLADLDLIGRRRDRAAMADVVAALGSDDLEIKEQAAITLGRLGGKTAIEALLHGLRAEHTYLDATITRALVHIGPDAVPSLVHALVDPSEIVRWHAAEALADIGDPRAIEPLLRAIDDSDPAVRWHAARGLVHLGEPALVGLLKVLETRPLTPWLSQGAKYVLRHVALGKPSRELHDLASALNHPTASVEVPLRAADAITALTSTSVPLT